MMVPEPERTDRIEERKGSGAASQSAAYHRKKPFLFSAEAMGRGKAQNGRFSLLIVSNIFCMVIQKAQVKPLGRQG